MKNLLQNILVTVLVFTFLVNVPIKFFSPYFWLASTNLGSVSLTDLQSSDLLSAFPTVFNANNTILENTLNSIIGTTTNSTITTLSGLTSAANLATVGTITTGTWNATTIATTRGGTGLTSYTTGDILYASASNVLSRLAASSTGEVLTLDASGVPVWRDASINPAGNFTFTGEWTFNGGGTATTTFNRGVDIDADTNTPLILNGRSYTFQSGSAASTSALLNDGSGNLTWNLLTDTGVVGRGYLLGATSTDTTLSDSTTETTYGSGAIGTIPASALGTSSGFEVFATIAGYSDSSGNDTGILRVALGGTTVCTLTLPGASTVSVVGQFRARVFNDSSASAQYCVSNIFLQETGTITSTLAQGYARSEGTSSVDTSVALDVTLTLDWTTNGAGTETLTVSNAEVFFFGKQ